MITKELMKNDFFTQRAQVLFVNENNFNNDEEESQINANMLNSILQEDIYFEIAEEFEEEQDYDFDGIERKQVPKFENCILFLNNIDQKLIKNAPNHQMTQ